MSSRVVTLTLTEREWEAIAAAWACYDAQYEYEHKESWPSSYVQDMRAFERLKNKWYDAKAARR